ncbi:MAG: MMPL family transporter [Gemmatimonadota bacterium]|nr:MAG: MMPL family transporter [Gemmatimonadota bacterium]
MGETMTGPARGRTERYTRWVIKNRWWVVLSALLVTMASGTGLSKLGLANDYRVFFSEDNPDLNAFETVENIYTKNDNVLFIVKPREGEVFTAANLEVIRSLTEDAWQIPFSTRVDAITNFQHTWADGDELIVEDLVGPGEITPEVVARARRVSLAEPLLAGRLIAPDALTTGVNVRISLPGEAVDELAQTVAYARGLVTEYSEAHPELEIQVGGLSMLNWAFAEAPMKDMPVVMPLMFLAFMITIGLFLRSGTGLVATLGVIGFSTATALGIAGHMGVFLDPTSASAPTIILTLAVADSVHILVSLLQKMREGRPKLDALVEAMRVNAKPVFLTSLTTVVGFLTLNFSDSPPFRLLGNLTAVGVIFAWIFSMTLLPALVAILPVKQRRASDGRMNAWLDRFSDMLVARYRPILAGMAVATVGLSVAVTTLEVNDHFLEYFAPSLEIRQASDFALDNLTGFYTATFSLEAGGSQEVSDPEYLAKVDEFADWLDARPNVAHVNSFTRTMKRLNMNMNADDPAEYRLPTGQELGAQYLLLYELSLPYGLDVNDQIDLDKSSLRVDVTFGDVDVKVVEQEVALAEAWLAGNGTPSMRSARATGTPLMFSKITRRNIASMLVGTGLGFALIAGILMIALKSVRLGVISLVPNVLPALMAFGVWAMLVGQIGFAVSIVAGLSIGIIVDDTVHFLSKYQYARDSMDAPDSVRYAFRTVGPAILGTTLIVAVGFAMLGLSTFRVTAYMGLLTSLTVACALVVDFLLLPAILLAFDRRPAKYPVPNAAVVAASGAA